MPEYRMNVETSKVIHTLSLLEYGLAYRVQYTATANDQNYSRLLACADVIYPNYEDAKAGYDEIANGINQVTKTGGVL